MDLAVKIFPVDYGSEELKKFYQTYLTRGVAVAIALHLFGVGTYWGIKYLAQDDEPIGMVRMLKYSEMGPPPSITNQAAPAVAVTAQAVKPSIGIPVPVPDAEVSPEQTIASQTELSQAVGPSTETGGGGAIEQDIKVDEAPADFVPVEKYPEQIKVVTPKYPEIALRAGLEGTVFVKAWVDKEGKVRKTMVLKSDAEIFNAPACDAVKEWVFTPAIMNKGPVDVWVTVPVKFKIAGR